MVLAGGCFWCVEADFDKVPGVLGTVSGYAGGHTKGPTYKQVTAGGTGHLEVVRIAYDADKVSFERLLHVFWRSIDPTDGGGQFCDRGESYTTAVFVANAAERAAAEASKQKIDASGVLGKPIATRILEAGPFYPAEDYHQDFYRTNPIRYNLYRFNCGRDRRIAGLWGAEAHSGISH